MGTKHRTGIISIYKAITDKYFCENESINSIY